MTLDINPDTGLPRSPDEIRREHAASEATRQREAENEANKNKRAQEIAENPISKEEQEARTAKAAKRGWL